VKPGFVHLHLHSEYSVLDGAGKIHDILEKCKEFGMKACAITDHGSLFGALDFYLEAEKAGIKPIIGAELYVAKTSRFDTSARTASASHDHFLLLCENEIGYRNLCRLSSLGYLEGHHYRPRVDLELLAKYREGLIAASGCLAGKIPRAIRANDMDAARKAVEEFIEIYGKDNFLIELMDHGLPEQDQVNPLLAELADEYGLLLIATNNCHYVNKEDAEAQEALLAIQTNTTLYDEKRFRFGGGPEYYFKSQEEMYERFKQWPQAVSNTEKVAARCNVKIPLNQGLIPEYTPPAGFTKSEYLKQLVQLGLEERYNGAPSSTHLERAKYELEVIEKMGFVDYFLVVWDLVNFARSRGIPVGPGRGSGAGSLVAYALHITNIDPIRYNLLFERFLNPERISMPDFDLDFCYNRRGEVIDYVREKYGRENVSQIITFGRMLAKQVVRNVGRVLGMPYSEVDRIAKLIPDELKITLNEAVAREPELARMIEEDPQVRKLWDLALRLEGVVGTCGTHAAGVIICDKPLIDHVPLFKAAGSDVVATQFEMKYAEKVGLLKMDLLGLRTLTVINDAVRFVKENRGISIDIDNLAPDDPKTYQLLRSGRTTGVFQLESAGMRDLAKRIGLESLEEICALVALYRPGPMAKKDEYIENKHHPERIRYDHPLLEPILKETYGIALYQEQVMQIVQALAGFTLGQADILRRAMGKKDAKLMAQQQEGFIEGCKKRGIDTSLAKDLFLKIEDFANYGFNKSHSMAYAYVAYQTAYLKANYPVEFMAALLTSESGNLDKIAQYVEECRRMGIDVLPPDVNSSGAGFTVEGENIRFGMGAIKNVGQNAVEAIVTEREQNGPFKDIFDFCRRIDSRVVNHRVLESLNKAGAFASTGWNRHEVESVLETAISEGQISQKEREIGQTSLFEILVDNTGQSATVHERPNLPEWSESQLLNYEKEMLGLYVSSHPLARYADLLERFSTLRLSELPDLPDGEEVTLGGLVANVKHHTTARGAKMAFVTIETLEGPCELTIFPELFEKRAGLLVEDMAVMVDARVNVRNQQPGLIASDIFPLDEAEKTLSQEAHIRLNTVGLEESTVQRLAEILGSFPGKCDVYLHCITAERDEVVVKATNVCRVAPQPEMKKEVENLLGDNCLWFSANNRLVLFEN